MPINDRYARLLARRAPPEERVLRKSLEAYEEQQGTNTRYILGAIAPVGAVRTARLVEQGNRVENQLQQHLKAPYPGIAFRRQGSVSNGTHIRYYSDVDVLVLIDKFYDLEPPQKPSNPYTGDPIRDLLSLRGACSERLRFAFPQATVDDTGSTCVSISGGSLVCRVDTVPAGWYDTLAYSSGQGPHTRGVMVLNRTEGKRIANYPFLFNYRVHEHDAQRAGVPRMLVRLLKSVKADHEEESSVTIGFSSFDVCSIVYRMPDTYLHVNVRKPLEMVRNLLAWTHSLLTSDLIRSALTVVDDSRRIFDSVDKIDGLLTLHQDLHAIYAEAVREQKSGHDMISEAHMAA